MLTIITLIAIFVLFIALDVAALRWGSDSTEKATSCVWQRRGNWSNATDDQHAVN
jgi:hypothetical protein